MERNFYNEEFEDLIKQKADQYKMYPSENVWRRVHRSLHSRRKWYWSGFVLLLSGVSYFAINELLTPRTTSLANKNTTPLSDKSANKEAKIIPFKEFRAGSNTKSDKKEARAANNTAFKIIPAFDIFEPLPVVQLSSGQETIRMSENVSSLSDINTRETINIRETFIGNLLRAVPSIEYPSLSFLKPHVEVDFKDDTHQTASVATTDPQQDDEQEEDVQKINWLQEMAVYELTIPKVKRSSVQFNFSPTMNYRKLSGSNNATLRTDAKNIPMAMNIEGDLNGLLNHKPALGFELGSAFLYAANKNLSFKAGLQFNYSRYDIIAYSSYSMEIATIALTNEYGSSADSLTSYTRLRNFGGDAQKDLRNQYFQFSAPVGMEWKILGNDRLQLKVAGTVQPTYLINRNTYLVTTDYKNYTREPSLVRRWNVNAGAEAFLSYRSGGVKWQVGPQFRYQLLSSYSNKYPIKEYLMEYGVKVGVSKTIK